MMDFGGVEMRHSGSSSSPSSSSPSKQAKEEAEVEEEEEKEEIHNLKFRGWNLSSLYFWKDDRLSRPEVFRKLSLALLCALLLAGFISLPPVWNRLNPPYLCKKEGIVLRCPHVKDTPSLWENPPSATTSWKPCAERHEKFSPPQRENETNGYILIHAEGGLNQQRISVRFHFMKKRMGL